MERNTCNATIYIGDDKRYAEALYATASDNDVMERSGLKSVSIEVDTDTVDGKPQYTVSVIIDVDVRVIQHMINGPTISFEIATR